MISRMAPTILITSLIAIWAVQPAASLDSNLEEAKDDDIVAAVLGVDRTKEFLGQSYKQAVLLYKDNSEDLDALKKLPDLVMELKNEICELKTIQKEEHKAKVKQLMDENARLRDRHTNTKCEEPTVREKKLRATLDLLADQLKIQKLVKAYNDSKNWYTLRKGLEDVLDIESPAYRQLQAISWRESYPPWQIAYDNHTQLVSVLVFAGRGINMTDGSADNMLHGAVAGGHVELVEMLLDNGAGIESRNAWGNAPLALACKYRRLPVAKLLWRRGAEVDGINYDERWAGLARGAENGDLEIVKFMVGIGASTTLKDRDGRTPLEVARLRGHTAVVEYLSQFPH